MRLIMKTVKEIQGLQIERRKTTQQFSRRLLGGLSLESMLNFRQASNNRLVAIFDNVLLVRVMNTFKGCDRLAKTLNEIA